MARQGTYRRAGNAYANALAILFIIFSATIMLAGCGGGGGKAVPDSSNDLKPAGNGAFSFAPPSALKNLAYVPDDLIRTGSSYVVAPGYPRQLTTKVGESSCRFSPDWDPAAPDPAKLSYAIYAFDLEGYDRSDEVKFTFDTAGNPGNAWVGLSYYEGDRWEWHPLPESNLLSTGLSRYIDGDTGVMLAFVLFLGTDAWTLDQIKIGDLAAVSGYVFADDGTTPLQNAEVVLSGTGEYSTSTDNTGYWEIEGVTPDNYTVTPHRVGWTFDPGNRQVPIAGEDLQVDGFNGTYQGGYTVSGHVEDNTFAGLHGVVMNLTRQGNPHGSVYAITDFNGNWEYELPDGDYTVTPAMLQFQFAPEYRDFSVAGGPVEVDGFTGTHVTGPKVDGYVYEDDGTTPMYDVQVSLYHDEIDMVIFDHTDVNGYWSVNDIPFGDYTVQAIYYGYGFAPAEQQFTAGVLDITLDPFLGTELTRHDVSGYVYMEDGTTPLAGANVEISGTSGWYNAPTNSQGFYRFEQMLAGEYSVTPTEPGYDFEPAYRDITVDTDVVVDPFLATELPSYTVDGYIYTDGGTSPVAGVDVSLFTYMPPGGGYSATTGFDGHYVITDVPDGVYVVNPSKQGLEFTPGTQSITVDGDNVHVPNFEATVPPNFTVDGYIYELDGTTPVENVKVELYGMYQGFYFSGTTDPSGHWEISGVFNETYFVYPTLAPWVFTPEDRTVLVSGADVSVPQFLGEELEAYQVEGFVYEEGSTTPVPDVEIDFENADYFYSCTTDVNGYYSIPLPTGEWEVWPYSDCWTFDPAYQDITVTVAPQLLPTFYATPGG